MAKCVWHEPGSRGWSEAWDLLATAADARGLGRDIVAYNERSCEAWQYMGTWDGEHQFRHRDHPSTGKREYLNVKVTASLRESATPQRAECALGRSLSNRVIGTSEGGAGELGDAP